MLVYSKNISSDHLDQEFVNCFYHVLRTQCKIDTRQLRLIISIKLFVILVQHLFNLWRGPELFNCTRLTRSSCLLSFYIIILWYFYTFYCTSLIHVLSLQTFILNNAPLGLLGRILLTIFSVRTTHLLCIKYTTKYEMWLSAKNRKRSYHHQYVNNKHSLPHMHLSIT